MEKQQIKKVQILKNATQVRNALIIPEVWDVVSAESCLMGTSEFYQNLPLQLDG